MITTEDRTYIEDLSYDNAEDFLHDISYGGRLYKIFDTNFIFRGHSTDKYKLLSSVQRINPYFEKYGYKKDISETELALAHTEFSQAFHEYQYLEDFFRISDENQLYVPEVKRMREAMPWNLQGFGFIIEKGEWLPEELYELATLAQHHGVPTRLLDWTQDLNVALYFAISGVIQKRLSKITDNNEDYLKKTLYYRTKELTKYKELRIEIWGLDKRVSLTHIGIPLRIIHPNYFNNVNLSAQKGLLTFWGIKKPVKNDKEIGLVPDISWKDEKTLDEHLTEFLQANEEAPQPYIYHITIPENSLSTLYKYIKRNRCDASTLFPTYDGVVRCMQEDVIINKMDNIL